MIINARDNKALQKKGVVEKGVVVGTERRWVQVPHAKPLINRLHFNLTFFKDQISTPKLGSVFNDPGKVRVRLLTPLLGL